MSVWKKIDGNGDDLMGSNGIPGDDALKIEVSVAIDWNNRTRVNAWNDSVGIEIMVDPAGLAELIDRLIEAQALQVVAAGNGCGMLTPTAPGELADRIDAVAEHLTKTVLRPELEAAGVDNPEQYSVHMNTTALRDAAAAG